MINIISSIHGRGSEFLSAEMATLKTVFPKVMVFAVSDPDNMSMIQSIMLAGIKGSFKIEGGINNPWMKFLSHDVTEKVPGRYQVLTDDLAPVDYYMAKAIK